VWPTSSFGVISLAIGGLAAMGGGLADIGTASFFTTMGAGLIAVGFWVSLFGKLELRLIDIQTEIAKGRTNGEEAP
jgi:hypothetical protein